MSSKRLSGKGPGWAPSRLTLLLGAAGVLSLVVLVVWWPGCREYPAVTSPEAMYLMKLLYSACNAKDEARLRKVEEGVQKATKEGKLSPAERQAFAHIIGLARRGEWESAEAAAFKFAQDQVGRGFPARE